MFFFSSEYKINPLLSTQSDPLFLKKKLIPLVVDLKDRIYAKGAVASTESIKFNHNNIVMSSTCSVTISIITLAILLFIFLNKE